MSLTETRKQHEPMAQELEERSYTLVEAAEHVADDLSKMVSQHANPKQAFGDKKVPLQLIPPVASAYTAIGLREGALKYGAWNFRETPIELMTYIGAIKRHCDAILEGEWIDPDDIVLPDGTIVDWLPKKPHLAGILASAAILADQYEAGNLVDNRPVANTGYNTLMKENMKNV